MFPIIPEASNPIGPLLAIAIALVLSLLATRLMKLLGLPNVTGYLIVGLIIGPHALGIISGSVLENLSLISTVALGFIGFSIGVEFKLSHIKEIGGKAITITLFQALAATLCVDLVLICFALLIPEFSGMEMSEAIIMGAIATATAPAATLMVVRQYKAKGIVTGTLLPVVALDDAVGLIVFAISNSIALSMAGGTQVTGAWPVISNFILWPLAEIVLSLVIGAGVGALLSLIPRFFKSRNNRLIATIIAVFMCLGVSSIFAWLKEEGYMPFALSDLLTCMMAGAIFVNLRKESSQMMEGADRWTPVLLMLFFTLSGAELDVTLLFSDWGLFVCIIAYIVFRCVGKYFGTMAGAAITKSHPNIRKYLGITLFPQAGVAIGMATMCKNEFAAAGLPEVGTKIVTITMCAVLIYELVGPLLTKIALTKAGEIAPENLGGRRKNKTVAVAAEGANVVANDVAVDSAPMDDQPVLDVDSSNEQNK